MSRKFNRFALALVALLASAEFHSVSHGEDQGQGPGDKKRSTAEKALVAVAPASEVSAVERALEKKVSIKLKATPLKEASAYLADLAGVNVLLDSKAIADAGATDEMPITFEMSDVSLGAAIRALLAEHDLGYTIPESNVLTITTADVARGHAVTRVYDVSDLVKHETAANEFANPTSGDADPLSGLITSCIQPTSWTAAGGIGAVSPAFGRLFVTNNLEVQDQVAELLRTLRSVRGVERSGPPATLYLLGSTPAEEKIRNRLARRQDVDFQKTPLNELENYLRKEGLPVSIDQKRLSDAGVAADVRLTLKAKQVPLKFALRNMLEPCELSYIVRDDSLVITSASSEKESVRVGFYPVADLVEIESADSGAALDFDTLIETITSVVSPTSWTDSGGIGSIGTFVDPTVLVIAQSEEIHEQITDLLGDLRAPRPTGKESAASKPAGAKPAAQAAEAMVVRVHRVAVTSDTAIDEYITVIRSLIEPNYWQANKPERQPVANGVPQAFISGIPGGIVVRQRPAVQKRVAALLAEMQGQGGGLGGGLGAPTPKGGGAFAGSAEPAARH